MRIIFAGTPDFAVAAFESLIQEFEVVAAFTQPDRRAGRGKKLLAPPVKVLAEKHHIAVHQPANLKDQAQVIEALKPDVMVVVAYGMLLPQRILDIPKLGCINIHASLLPRWRGAAPIQRALQAGDTQTGVSIMRMEAGLDTGPVFEMLSTDIATQDTSASLHDRLSALGAKGIISTLARLQSEPDWSPVAQADQGVSYAHKIDKHEAQLDWHNSATHLNNQIRAFNPWPGCETWHAGNRIRIWQASVSKTVENFPPGTVLTTQPELKIACGEHTLVCTSLQRDGGKALPAAQFLNGYDLQPDERFTTKADG